MFNLFKRKIKKEEETIEDDFFGRLSFIQATEYEPSYLFGAKVFAPLNSTIEYKIFSDTKTIINKQINLALEIENNYGKLVDKIEHFINVEYIKKTNIDRKYNLQKDLELILITIPNQFEPQVEWSLEFRVKGDFTFFTVEFKDWEPFWLSISA